MLLRKVKRNLRVYNNTTRKPYDEAVVIKSNQNRYRVLEDCGYSDNAIKEVVDIDDKTIDTIDNNSLDTTLDMLNDIQSLFTDKIKTTEEKEVEVETVDIKDESIDKTKAIDVKVEEIEPEKEVKLETKTVLDNKAKMKNGFVEYSDEAKVIPEVSEYDATKIINEALKKNTKDIEEETKKEFDKIKTEAKKNVEKLKSQAKANKTKSEAKKNNEELVNDLSDEEIINKAIEDLTKDIECSDKEREIQMLKDAFKNKSLVEIYRNKYKAEAKTKDIVEENKEIIKDNKQKVDNKVKEEDKQENVVDKGEKKGVKETVKDNGDGKPNYKTEKIDNEEYVYLPIEQEKMNRLVNDVKKKYDKDFNKSINKENLQRTIVGILADTGILEKAKTYNQLYNLTIKEMDNLIDTNTVELANDTDKSDDELLNHLNSIFE